MRAANDLFPGWGERRIRTDAGIVVHTGGLGPPLLLLHGYPQTHACWRKPAAGLARHCTLVVADLRGRGASSVPADSPRAHELCEANHRQLDEGDLKSGQRIACPTCVAWGRPYLGKRGAERLQGWHAWCSDPSGAEIDAGYFLAEQNPDATLAAHAAVSCCKGGRSGTGHGEKR